MGLPAAPRAHDHQGISLPSWRKKHPFISGLNVTVSITAMVEAARTARFINVLLTVALMFFAPFMFDGGSGVADLAGVAAGVLLAALSAPRGRIDNPYGG